MVISSKRISTSSSRCYKFYWRWQIPEPVKGQQFQKQQNQMVDEPGIAYETNIIVWNFWFWENNIDNESVNLLFSALKYNNKHKNLYGLNFFFFA